MHPPNLVLLYHFHQALGVRRLIPVRPVLNEPPFRNHHGEQVLRRRVLGINSLEALLVPLALKRIAGVVRGLEIVLVDLEHDFVLEGEGAGVEFCSLSGGLCARGAV
jgi:hypothetical protein